MKAGEPVIFENLAIPFKHAFHHHDATEIAERFASTLGAATKVRVRAGRSQQPISLTMKDLVRRWKGGRAVVNITDLKIRQTPITRLIDISHLSEFNLLPRSRDEAIRRLELLTLVISSTRSSTDSHTDDLDGSNHCFAGRKLWLIWDVIDGLARGLEDVERTVVFDRAAFDIETFLSLPSSRWFILSKGQTLFLPANFAHKVITLEPYLGVGSFFVMLPHYLRTLLRWKRLTPLWSVEASWRFKRTCLLDDVTRMVTLHVRRLINAPSQLRRFWGLGQLVQSVHDWDRRCSIADRQLLSDQTSIEFLKAVRELCVGRDLQRPHITE